MNRYLTVDDIRRIDVPKQPVISPDGSAVAYVVQTDDLDADRVEQTLWLVPTGGGNARRLTDGVGDCAPAWSPDGRLLAFLRTTDGRPQIWLLDVGTSEARQLTRRPAERAPRRSARTARGCCSPRRPIPRSPRARGRGARRS